jgi:hypothetical protein
MESWLSWAVECQKVPKNVLQGLRLVDSLEVETSKLLRYDKS